MLSLPVWIKVKEYKKNPKGITCCDFRFSCFISSVRVCACVCVCGEPPRVQWLIETSACVFSEGSKGVRWIPAQRHSGWTRSVAGVRTCQWRVAMETVGRFPVVCAVLSRFLYVLKCQSEAWLWVHASFTVYFLISFELCHCYWEWGSEGTQKVNK